MALLRSWGSQQRYNSPDSFQAYATDEIQPVGSSTGVMTQSFIILSNYALTLGCMEIGISGGHACQTRHCHIALWCTHQGTTNALELILELFDEVLCRLDLSCFLGCWWCWSETRHLRSALDDLDSTVHFDNFQSITWWHPKDGRTRGVCHIPTGVYLVGLCTGGTRMPADRPM